MRKEIWLMLAVALGLRLIAINQSLWLDEAVSINAARNFAWTDFIGGFSTHDFHPPLYYLMLKAWGGLFGFGVVAMRLPSVIFGVVTVYIIAKINKGASWLMAVNPLLIYYSQEARMYSLTVMCLTGCLYFFEKIIKKNNLKNIIFYNLFSTLAILSFYGSVFFLAGLSLYWLFKKKYKLVLLTNIGSTLALAGLTPLLREQLKNSQTALLEVRNWTLVLGKVTLKNLLLIPIKFGVGRISFYPKKLYWLLAGIWIMILGLNVKKDKKLWFLLLSPIALALIVSIRAPMIQYFRFLYLVPIFCLLLKPKKIVIGGFLVWSLVYLLIPKFHREDWQSLANEAGKEVWMVATVADPMRYYRPEIRIRDLKTETAEAEKIEVIPYAVEVHGLDYEKELRAWGYEKTAEKSFREMKQEWWEKKKI
ncbi:glycosyltransferase family 39 protein [Patescibacteria group bacterium]|nr:glycosyltransferase family 39 protein [Patescibacteria group bacterium]